MMIDLDKQREAFEVVFRKILGAHGCQFDLDEDGNYEDRDTNCGWYIWLHLQPEIDSLKAQLEQLDKVWISVDFMLPNEGEKVLIMIGDEQTVAEKCNVFGFIDVLDREALRTDLITYWMPLPKPPVKETTQENSHE